MKNYICLLQKDYTEMEKVHGVKQTLYSDLVELCMSSNISINDFTLYEVKPLADCVINPLGSGVITNSIEIVKKISKKDIVQLSKKWFKKNYYMYLLLLSFKYDESFLEEFIKYSCKNKLSEKVDYSIQGDLERALIVISREQILSEDFIRKYSNILHLYYVYLYQKNISEQFKEEFVVTNMDWYSIPLHNSDDNFLIKFKEKIDWMPICRYRKLSADIIDKCKSMFTSKHWQYISSNDGVSEVALMRNADNVYWDLISKRKNLSETFKEVFKDKLV